MSEASKQKEQIALWAKSMFDRGLTCGASGNISVRLSTGELLVTPTGKSMGFLDPAEISHFDTNGTLIDGLAPTKELPLHSAFYETRNNTGAVVHLHSTHSVALSVLPETDPDNVIPPLTAYSIMRVAGKDLEATVFAMEELEETAKLALITRGASPILLSDQQQQELLQKFPPA